MDKIIRRFDAVPDGDLNLCPHRGVAYQRDMRVTARYDEGYFAKCRSYEDKAVAVAINRGRIDLVARHHGAGPVLDVGVGSGEFVRKRPKTWGFDVNPVAVRWLRERLRWSNDLADFPASTFWDVIEHVPDPGLSYFRRVSEGAWLFTSVPLFRDLGRIRESRHYRPGEHLYYWTEEGFVRWMAEYRFRMVERASFEIDAGRDEIYSFAFRKDLPGYNDTLAQYAKMHAESHYGASSSLYLDLVLDQVRRLNPRSILDYGCGRSDLAAHFYLDGARAIARYDPAIPEFRDMPQGEFGLVLCNDVLEHIPLHDVDRVLAEVRAKSQRALFTISLKPARAHLPDGRNAHVTLLTRSEWTRWIDDVFGKAAAIPTRWDHVLMLRTW